MTHSLKEHFKNLLEFGMAIVAVIIALIVIVFAVFGLTIHNWFSRRRKNVPMDAYPHL